MTVEEQNAHEQLARGLAIEAHRGQTDRADEPYWLHLAAVAAVVEAGTEREAAWLHDVLEDTAVTAEDLREAGIREKVIRIVQTLTRRDGEKYRAYIERVRSGAPEAVRVKRADLTDHLARTGGLNPGMTERYRTALDRLQATNDERAWPQPWALGEPRLERRGRHLYVAGTGRPESEERRAIGDHGGKLAEDLRKGESPEKCAWAAVHLGSGALDVLQGKEREGEAERAYAIRIHRVDCLPRRGETYETFPELGTTVEIEGVWPLPDRLERSEDWTVSGLTLRLATKGRSSIAAPRNYDGGFYGTWRDGELPGGTGPSAREAWLTVLKVHGTGGRATGEDRLLREALDSRRGRHYADRVRDSLARAGGNLDKAVRRAGMPRGGG